MTVAVAMTLPTTVQYIFCRSDRLGTPFPVDVEPMGMSDINMLGGGGERGEMAYPTTSTEEYLQSQKKGLG